MELGKGFETFCCCCKYVVVFYCYFSYICMHACIHRHISYGNSRITMIFYYLFIHPANIYDCPLTIITIATKYISKLKEERWVTITNALSIYSTIPTSQQTPLTAGGKARSFWPSWKTDRVGGCLNLFEEGIPWRRGYFLHPTRWHCFIKMTYYMPLCLI